jgi:hypothetical protein
LGAWAVCEESGAAIGARDLATIQKTLRTKAAAKALQKLQTLTKGQ